jgi:hypothetical protein
MVPQQLFETLSALLTEADHVEAPVLSSDMSLVNHPSPSPPSPRAVPRFELDILSLPLDIFRCINEFTSVNCLVNTSRRLRNEKHSLFYWRLNRLFSDTFYFNQGRFRERLLSSSIAGVIVILATVTHC